MENKKIGFLTFEQYHGRVNIGSSMIRAKWVIEKWKDKNVELFKHGQKYDVIIFQKVYWTEYAEGFDGIKILDLCDPDWLHWHYKVKQMIEACDAVTCNTDATADYIRKLTDKPVITVPDRINLDKFTQSKVPKIVGRNPRVPKKKKHVGPTKKVVWYGYSDNFEVLESALTTIKKLDLELIVISNNTFTLPAGLTDIKLINLPWSGQHWQNDLMRADVVLNPKLETGKWGFKSNNKTINAWALGLPVAHTAIELKKLLTEEERIAEAEKRYKEVREDYNVEKSVDQLRALIQALCQSKSQQ